MKLATLILVAVLGCTHLSVQPPTLPTVADSICWNADLRGSPRAWRREVDRRFPGAVILSAHGNNYQGTWMIFPDPPLYPITVEQACLLLKSAYGDRFIVLIVCNPSHADLNVGGVFYAKDTVWASPHSRSGPLGFLRVMRPTNVGSIDKFVEGREVP